MNIDRHLSRTSHESIADMLSHFFTLLRYRVHCFSEHPLTRDALVKAWARFVWWQISCRLREEVIVTWIAGTKLAVRKGMFCGYRNIYVGLEEFEGMMFLLHFLREGDLFLDIGANVGSFTVLASGVCRARTWAFEPALHAVRQLKRNIEINRLDDRVTIHECALGSSEDNVPFTVGRGPMNKVATAREENIRLVRQERLDSLIGGARPIMIKMDVEGYEEEVIRGATNLITNKCIRVVELETVTADVMDLLVRNEFELVHYNPFSRNLERYTVEADRAKSLWNALFVRDWAFVNSRLIEARPIEVLDRVI